MDKLSQFQNAITAVLEEYAKIKFANIDNCMDKIIDAENHRYLLVVQGWDDVKRIYYTLFDVQIKGDKIWIHHDQTEYSIALELVDRGILQSDIVLGYFSPERRKLTDFAAA